MTPTDQAHDHGEDAAIEQPAIQLFADLGWETVNLYHEWNSGGSTEGRESEAQVILEDRLRAALESLNPDLPPAAISQVIEELTRERSRMGKGILAFLSALAKDERERITSRLSEGRAAAKARGVKFGPKFKLSEHQRVLVLQRLTKGESCRSIALDFRVSHTTILRLQG